MSRAVVLLSGGLDSVTCLALARREGLGVLALSFAYGQRHAAELGCAARQAARWGAEAHEIVDLSHLGRLVAPATSLVAGGARPPAAGEGAAIPSTYVPARNTLFLSYGLAWAEAVGAGEVWIGVNAIDYSGYPDGACGRCDSCALRLAAFARWAPPTPPPTGGRRAGDPVGSAA